MISVSQFKINNQLDREKKIKLESISQIENTKVEKRIIKQKNNRYKMKTANLRIWKILKCWKSWKNEYFLGKIFHGQ